MVPNPGDDIVSVSLSSVGSKDAIRKVPEDSAGFHVGGNQYVNES